MPLCCFIGGASTDALVVVLSVLDATSASRCTSAVTETLALRISASTPISVIVVDGLKSSTITEVGVLARLLTCIINVAKTQPCS